MNADPGAWKRRVKQVSGHLEHPIELLQRNVRQMNRVFDDLLGGIDWEPLNNWQARLAAFSPVVNVVEQSEMIVVTAELPGMDQSDVDVSLTSEALIIRGERKREVESEDGYFESTFGKFERKIAIEAEIEEERVDASFSKGILTISLPKKEASACSGKKIEVRSVE